ncbi:hypothetical protein G6F68_000879 [Rhizopus microsporus]|nr:hypothetical protein G6F67_001368 [Rhizopus microsporus]KAG1268750.1 hypothetical protein G6F68_000879 [Rhizopus microsporus]
MAIANTLFLFDKESTRKTGGAVRYKYNQSEIDVIIKSGSVLVQNTFASSSKISIGWGVSSFSLMEELPKEYLTTLPDIIIICCKGIEVGYGKVKPPKKSKELIDIDRARIAEICKRQLHLHLQFLLKKYGEDSREAVESLNTHSLGLKIAKNAVHGFMVNVYALTIKKAHFEPKEKNLPESITI